MPAGLSWFVDHIIPEDERGEETYGEKATTKVAKWHERETKKVAELKKQRSGLSQKLQNALNECELLRLQLETNSRELERSQYATHVASTLLVACNFSFQGFE